jgi:hypothetical protein
LERSEASKRLFDDMYILNRPQYPNNLSDDEAYNLSCIAISTPGFTIFCIPDHP